MARSLVVLTGFLIGSLFRPGPVTAQAQALEAAHPSDSEIQRLIATRVDTERRNSGIVVGIVTPGGRRIVSHGRRRLNDPRGPDGDTVFEIGSVTKLFTSVLLADMVRRGEVKLTDSVFSYLPPRTSRDRENRTITLAGLATHTSGLPLWPSGIPATRDGALSMATYTRAQLLEPAAAVRLEQVPPRVVILTTFARQGYLRRALDAGAVGYVLKDAPSSRLADAIRRAHAGNRVIDSALAGDAWGEADPLSNRERQVLRLAGEGRSGADIPAELYLSEGTVRNYLSEAISKTGGRNRVDAARIARDKGWL
jgi:DNA-binding NarL/FixJ family response regulator